MKLLGYRFLSNSKPQKNLLQERITLSTIAIATGRRGQVVKAAVCNPPKAGESHRRDDL